MNPQLIARAAAAMSKAMQAILAAVKGRFIPWLLALWGQIALVMKGVWRDWVDSAKSMMADIVSDGDPSLNQLTGFLDLLNQRSTAFDDKIESIRRSGVEKIDREKAKMLLSFDQQTLRLQGKNTLTLLVFNESFRLSLRSRLVHLWDDTVTRILAKADALAAQIKRNKDKLRDEIAGKANEAYQKAEATRSQIAALRLPAIKGRSLAQVESLLRNVKDGDNKAGYTREQLENDIKGRKLEAAMKRH